MDPRDPGAVQSQGREPSWAPHSEFLPAPPDVLPLAGELPEGVAKGNHGRSHPGDTQTAHRLPQAGHQVSGTWLAPAAPSPACALCPHGARGPRGAFAVTHRVFLPGPVPAEPRPFPSHLLVPVSHCPSCSCPGLSLPRATGCVGSIGSLCPAPSHPCTNPRNQWSPFQWWPPALLQGRSRGLLSSCCPGDCPFTSATLTAPIPRQDAFPASQSSPWGHPLMSPLVLQCRGM